jgi:aldose 1-epimerase
LVLENENLKIKILSFGATLTDFILKKENSLNIVLGYENRETYILNNQPRLGVICGRFANRIAKGEFELNEKKYFLK